MTFIGKESFQGLVSEIFTILEVKVHASLNFIFKNYCCECRFAQIDLEDAHSLTVLYERYHIV